MGAGEECSHCHNCKPAALWDRSDGMNGQLWTERSCGEPGQCWIKYNGSGKIRDVGQFCNHRF